MVLFRVISYSDLLYYNVFRLIVEHNATSTGESLAPIDYLVAFLIFITAFSSYQYGTVTQDIHNIQSTGFNVILLCIRSERSIREAFLLQAQIQSEQTRTQKILDNIFPPHSTTNTDLYYQILLFFFLHI